MIEFAPGILVKLKGHNTVMTIADIEDDRAHCVWFDEYEKFYRATFLVEYLELV